MRKIALLLIIGLTMAIADTFVISKNETLTSLTTPTQAENEIINRCTKPSFSTPVDVKTLGIKGDGSDESAALQTLLNSGGSFLFKDITVVLNNRVQVTANVDIKMVFENGKLEATVQKSPNLQKMLIYVSSTGGFFEIDGAELDGNEMVNEGLRIDCDHEVHNCNIHHFSSVDQDNVWSASGIVTTTQVNKNLCSSIHDNYIHDIWAWDSGAPADGSGGGANGVWVLGNSASREVHAYIERNTIEWCYGEEGAGVYVQDDDADDRNGKCSYFIDNNIMTNINRRMFKAYGSNITFTNNVMTTFPLGSPHIKYGAHLIDIARGSLNPIVGGNKIYSTGHDGGMMNLSTLKNGHVFNNEFNHIGATGSTAGRIADLTDLENMLIENNIFETTSDDYFRFNGLNIGDGVTIKNNLFKVVHGNLYFSWMYGGEKKNITIENNIIDCEASGVPHTVKFKTLLQLDWGGVALNNVKVIGNKIIGGVNNNAEGFIAREDSYTDEDKYSYTDVLFQDNEADGSEDIFRIYGDTLGITFKNNTDK